MNFKTILFKTLFVVGTTLWCIVFGAFIGRMVTPPGGMGWDALANALGGMMLGGLLGAVVSLLLAVFLRGRALLMAYVASGSIFTLTLLAVVVRIIIISN